MQLYGQVEGSAYSVLCGWSVAHLAAGETREIVVPVDVAALARWDSEAQELIVPPVMPCSRSVWHGITCWSRAPSTSTGSSWMADHHDRTIAAWCAVASQRGAVGVIVVGSVARGTARDDSDVDVYDVLPDDACTALWGEGRALYVDEEIADYPGGYVDVKVVSRRPAAARDHRRGRPVPRVPSSVLASRSTPKALSPASSRQSSTRRKERFDALVETMLAQASLHGRYFLRQGLGREDAPLTSHAAVHAAYAIGRAVLARHRVLFRGQKYLTEQLVASGEDAVATALGALCAHPSMAGFEAAAEAAAVVVPDPNTALGRFVLDNEGNWFTGIPVPEHR